MIKYLIDYYLVCFSPVNEMIELVLYLFILNFTYPSHVFAYSWGYAYLRLNITALGGLPVSQLSNRVCGVLWDV
jgi:hypothetical protein